MMRRIYILTVLLTLSFIVQGQLLQKVILKNGSEITGKVSSKDSLKIKLETKTGDLLVFRRAEIDTILPSEYLKAQSGLFMNIETVLLVGRNQLNPLLQLKWGYNFNQKTGLALGASIENYFNRSYIPLFLELKYHIFNHHITPYVNVQGGYLFSLDNHENYKGGFMTSASLNMVCYTGEHFGITIGGGYRFNRIVREVNSWSFDNKDLYIHHINRIEIKLGMIFK